MQSAVISFVHSDTEKQKKNQNKTSKKWNPSTNFVKTTLELNCQQCLLLFLYLAFLPTAVSISSFVVVVVLRRNSFLMWQQLKLNFSFTIFALANCIQPNIELTELTKMPRILCTRKGKRRTDNVFPLASPWQYKRTYTDYLDSLLTSKSPTGTISIAVSVCYHGIRESRNGFVSKRP